MKLLSLIILLFYAPLVLQSQHLEVCADCEYSTIADALLAVEDGDIVRVKSGTYFEHHLNVNKSIRLIGEKGAIIDGENLGEILTVEADGVHIEGFTIRNVGTSYTEDRSAIRIRKSKNFVIKNNVLENTFFGIYLEHSKEGEIIDNRVIGEAQAEMSSGNAIHAWYCRNLLVTGNIVKNHRDGIYFEFVDKSMVTHNVSEDNLRYGLHFMFSNEDEYHNNAFRNNGAGVAVMFSKKINMWRNVFEFNWGKSSYGLLLKEIYDATILENIFRENTVGIYVEGSTRIQYEQNDFIQNGWAIKIAGGCLDNEVKLNNFISNTFDLSLKNNNNQNSFDHNYWSEYSGYDLDKDGEGDIPYRPVKLFNYIVDIAPESLVLLESLFVDLINFSEKVSPSLTPKNVLDHNPIMYQIPRNSL